MNPNYFWVGAAALALEFLRPGTLRSVAATLGTVLSGLWGAATPTPSPAGSTTDVRVDPGSATTAKTPDAAAPTPAAPIQSGGVTAVETAVKTLRAHAQSAKLEWDTQLARMITDAYTEAGQQSLKDLGLKPQTPTP